MSSKPTALSRVKIKNLDNLDEPASVDFDLDAIGPDIVLPQHTQKQYPLTVDELNDDYALVTRDGGVKKKILIESKDKSDGLPTNDSKIVCHYVATLPNKNNFKFDSSRDRDKAYEFKLGTGKVIQGWEFGVATMYKGEKAIIRIAPEYGYGDKEQGQGQIPANSVLDFEIELIDFDPWQEVRGDEKNLKKKVIKASDKGYDAEINADFQVNVNYKMYYLDNSKQKVVIRKGNRIDLVVNDDDRFTNAFHKCLRNMKNGEKTVFKILNNKLLNVDDVYMDDDKLLGVPSNQSIYYEIKINSMVKCKLERWNAKNFERMKVGLKYKNEGNNMFKIGRYYAAITKYTKSLEWVDVDLKDEKNKKIVEMQRELRIDSNNNMALIYIKKKDWSSAIEKASLALKENPYSLKGLMRRGQARIYEGFLDLAREDLQNGLLIDPQNKYIKKMLKIIDGKYKEYQNKEKQLYAGMFGGVVKKKKKKKKKKNQDNDNDK